MLVWGTFDTLKWYRLQTATPALIVSLPKELTKYVSLLQLPKNSETVFISIKSYGL